MTIKRTSLAEVLQDELGLSGTDSALLIKICFEEVVKVLAEGNNLHISGLGRFLLRDKGERMGRNPKDKTPAVISSRRVVVFLPGPKLKQRIEESTDKRKHRKL